MTRELARRMDEIPVPEGLEDRVRAAARATARAGATQQAGRRRRRRRIAILATAALVVGGAGSAAGYWLATRDDDVNTVPAGPEARAAISESAVLARLPWLSQPSGTPVLADTAPAPSVAFPPGTSYAAALDRLLRSVVERGALPRGTIVEPALPTGVVWAPGSGGAGRAWTSAPPSATRSAQGASGRRPSRCRPTPPAPRPPPSRWRSRGSA